MIARGCCVLLRAWQVDRRRTPWLVAGVHRQMVGPTTDPVNILTSARLQSELEGLFLKYKVDLVLQGESLGVLVAVARVWGFVTLGYNGSVQCLAISGPWSVWCRRMRTCCSSRPEC